MLKVLKCQQQWKQWCTFLGGIISNSGAQKPLKKKIERYLVHFFLEITKLLLNGPVQQQCEVGYMWLIVLALQLFIEEVTMLESLIFRLTGVIRTGESPTFFRFHNNYFSYQVMPKVRQDFIFHTLDFLSVYTAKSSHSWGISRYATHSKTLHN